MTPAMTPYFDPNQMPPWLRGGPRLNLGGVLGMPPRPMPPVGMPPGPDGQFSGPGNVFNSGSLLQAPPMMPPNMQPPNMLPPNFGPGSGPSDGARPVQGMPVGPGPQNPLPPMPAPVGDPGGPGGIGGPYQPISQALNPMAGMAQPGRQRMSRPGMVNT